MAGLAAVLLLRGGGDDDADEPAAERPAAAASGGPRLEPGGYPGRGIVLARPAGWSGTLRGGVVRLVGPGRSVAVSIVSAPRSASPAALAGESERSLRRAYRRARVTRRARARLAGLPARSIRVAVPRGRDRNLDILVLTARSRWRSYAVTVFGSRPVNRARLAETQLLLNSLQFVRPRR